MGQGRAIDWDRRLVQYLADVEGRRFKWGEFDCCLFAAGAVDTQTGSCFLENFWHTYDTRFGACRIIRDTLGRKGDLADLFNHLLGAETAINPKLAQRGDPVVVRFGDTQAAGINYGEHSLVMSDYGWIATPAKVEAAWSLNL